MRERGRWMMKEEGLILVSVPAPERPEPETPRWPEPERKELYEGHYL